MSTEEKDIKDLIDNDAGLKSKRSLLTITSLILLGMTWSGAKVVEANTFILKVVFTHQEGVAYFLAVAIIFLLIRYYNYAKPYHNKLYKLWSSRMLNEPFFYQICPHSDDVSGLIYDVQPKGADIGDTHHENNVSYDWSYKCGFPFKRYIIYTWFDGHDYGDVSVSLFDEIDNKKYLEVVKLELKYRFSSFFNYRENLDILAPYMIGAAAIFSFIFS